MGQRVAGRKKFPNEGSGRSPLGAKKKAAPKNSFAAGLARMRWGKLTPEQRKEELARVRKQRGKPKGK